jgi:hypothetical protein
MQLTGSHFLFPADFSEFCSLKQAYVIRIAGFKKASLFFISFPYILCSWIQVSYNVQFNSILSIQFFIIYVLCQQL